MASISERVLPSGQTQIRLMWRDSSRVQRQFPMPDRETAERWQQTFDLLGADLGERALAEAVEEPSEPSEPEPVAEPEVRRTVRYVVDDHIATRKKLTAGTRADYTREAERDIYPLLGDLLITDLLNEDIITAWINNLTSTDVTIRRKPLSGKTVANRHQLLSGACNRAVKKGWLPRNPVYGWDLPDSIVEAMVFLSPAEYKLVRTCVTEYWRPFIDVLVGTGLRFSELTALRIQDVSFQTRHIQIRQSHKWQRGAERELGVPKSRAGLRRVPFRDDLEAILINVIGDRPGTDYVFLNRIGKPIRNNSFHSRIWGPAMKRAMAAGLQRRPRPHDLRHTFASWTLSSGKVNMFMLAKIMGHANTAMLQEVYGHMLPESMDAVADAAGSKFAEAMNG